MARNIRPDLKERGQTKATKDKPSIYNKDILAQAYADHLGCTISGLLAKLEAIDGSIKSITTESLGMNDEDYLFLEGYVRPRVRRMFNDIPAGQRLAEYEKHLETHGIKLENIKSHRADMRKAGLSYADYNFIVTKRGIQEGKLPETNVLMAAVNAWWNGADKSGNAFIAAYNAQVSVMWDKTPKEQQHKIKGKLRAMIKRLNKTHNVSIPTNPFGSARKPTVEELSMAYKW